MRALPDGTVFFLDEPILNVATPLLQVEPRLMLHFQSLIASKARLMAARAAHLSGFDRPAKVEAGRRFALPSFGTMAHSSVQSFGNRTRASVWFARARPDGLAFVIVSYDTKAAARKVVHLAPRLGALGVPVCAGRLGSGDLGALAASPRRILGAGRTHANTPWERPPGPDASRSYAAGHEGRHSSSQRRDSHGREGHVERVGDDDIEGKDHHPFGVQRPDELDLALDIHELSAAQPNPRGDPRGPTEPIVAHRVNRQAVDLSSLLALVLFTMKLALLVSAMIAGT